MFLLPPQYFTTERVSYITNSMVLLYCAHKDTTCCGGCTNLVWCSSFFVFCFLFSNLTSCMASQIIGLIKTVVNLWYRNYFRVLKGAYRCKRQCTLVVVHRSVGSHRFPQQLVQRVLACELKSVYHWKQRAAKGVYNPQRILTDK